jgi:hypothetical protein
MDSLHTADVEFVLLLYNACQVGKASITATASVLAFLRIVRRPHAYILIGHERAICMIYARLLSVPVMRVHGESNVV